MALAVGELYASLQLDTGAFEQSMERAARLLEQGLDVANGMADALNAAADDAERMADALLKAQGERAEAAVPGADGQFIGQADDAAFIELPVKLIAGEEAVTEFVNGAREAAGAAGGELGSLLSAGMAASLEAGGGGACLPMLEAVAAQLAGLYDVGFSDGALLSAGVAAGIRSKLGEIRAAAAMARLAARADGGFGAPSSRSGATVSPISAGQLRLPVAAPVSLSAPGASVPAVIQAAVQASVPAAIAAPALEGRAAALARVGDPGGRSIRRAEPAAVRASLEIDYERLADAMERREAVLLLDGRQVARLQAANAARAANARNRRIALGLGK